MTDLTIEDFPGGRRPIPVSTIDWRSTDRAQFIPIHGLDFLIGITQLQIQQTVELGDSMCLLNSIYKISINNI